MGNSKSKRNKQKLAQDLLSQKDAYYTVLLGTGQSGKSTLFRQIKKIYGDDTQMIDVTTVRQNVTETVNLILRELLSEEQNDKRSNVDFLNLMKNEEEMELIQGALDRKQIGWDINTLCRDKELYKEGKPSPDDVTHTQAEIMPKLIDIVENRMPKVKKAMKLTFSKAFDLNSLSDCVLLLIMFMNESICRLGDACKIEIDEWDRVLDNTAIDLTTATINEIKQYSDTITSMIGEKCTDRCQQNMESYGKALAKVWHELKQFRYVYYNLGVKYHKNYIDNIDYFFNKCPHIYQRDFASSREDMIRLYVRTTGTINQQFHINGCSLHIVDTGGQRNERKKWEYCFSNGCDAIMYIAGLDHFRQSLFEANSENALSESINCFQNVLTHKKWGKFKTILVLNKTDLFKQSLKMGHKLSVCFGDEYVGTNYDPAYDAKIINTFIKDALEYNETQTIPMEIVNIVCNFLDWDLSLKFAYEEGIEFIKHKFLSVNKKKDKEIEVFVISCIVIDDVQKIMKQIWDSLTRKEGN